MASQYQHRHFFRRVPNALLALYFEGQGVDLGLDFGKLKETEVEPIFEAFTALPEAQQTMMEVQFQDINALASDGGIDALLNEAAFYEDEGFAEEIAKIDGHHARTMWAFLNRQRYWKGASALLHADSVAGRFWKKRNDLPKLPPQVEEEDLQQLEQAISNYFSKKEGRGRNCKVEPYRKVENGKEYFFAYPEDYGRRGMEWEPDGLTARSRHPAFEIIFVYCQAEGSLDIYAPRNTKAVPELQRLFAKAILKLDSLEDGTIDKRVYDLDPLANPEFEFKPPADSGITDVVVTLIRLTLKHGSKRRIVLEADTKRNSMAVYDLLKELNPPDYFITQVGVRAYFEAEPGKRPGSKSFTIGWPNSCNLNHAGRDETLRKMLVASGIEPHPVTDDDSA